MKTLTKLFNKHHSDKGTSSGDRHNYGPLYDLLFGPIRFDVRKILELGVGSGGSIACWLEFFPHARIIGFDRNNYNDKPKFRNEERIKIYQGEATDAHRIVEETGFDIIVDDLDHLLETQTSVIQHHWPKLKNRGIYVIEDLFVGDLPWGGAASPKRIHGALTYSGHGPTPRHPYLPLYPQDVSFLNRQDLPGPVIEILQQNGHFFAITNVSEDGGLHMSLIIRKEKRTLR